MKTFRLISRVLCLVAAIIFLVDAIGSMIAGNSGDHVNICLIGMVVFLLLGDSMEKVN